MENKEYIERYSLLQSKDWLALQALDRARAKAIILGRRAADVVEVRHGEWVEQIETPEWLDDDVEVYYECSVCGCNNWGESAYCPNCGAKMDGKDGDK